ncbi:terminase [Bifidobacterium platyrrhinorum]|uniref:Terminase n=1 Tax=Bifidobacterium platyrrhinorum TaxID=2661628 RepID=A0A6L9SXK6_9BIFI|nr:terminase [Bifidobacterium platyrrhinorum]NEG56142.1 terminase [Bifidobacterium platyrrhinorum]
MDLGEIDDGEHGRTLPRMYTPPLRELTPETSNGFSVIAFAERFLGVRFYPWQKWLLIHALELNPDGSYRFRQVITLVARQNGKTTIMGVLCAWWLFVDSIRHPDRVPPYKFLVVGAAQTLDNARAPYQAVLNWCNPSPSTAEEAALAVPALQSRVQRVNNSHGEEAIVCRSKAQYIVRADKSIRSKSAARVVFDELREQYNEDGWNAVSQTTKAIWSSQLWGISNAGDYRSVKLRQLVDSGRRLVASWAEDVEAGDVPADTWAAEHDASFGYFEWSAPDGCAIDDRDAVRQANPSMGYGAMTYRSIVADLEKGMTEAAFRTEVLCQWVTADIIPYIDPKQWKRGIDDTSSIPDDGRVVLSVDTSADRETTYIAAAGYRADGLPHVELIVRRDGMLWVPKYLRLLKERWPSIHEVAIQSKGCPAVDFCDPLTEEGWTVHMIEGFRVGAAAGRFRDRIRDGKLRHLPQPAIEQQAAVAITRRLGEVEVWDRQKSVMQISGLIAESQALYALETMSGEPEKPKYRPSTGIRIHC